MTELHYEPEEYWEGLGFHNCGQYEWKNKANWTVEFMGHNKRPNCWRIDDFDNDGNQVLFIDIKNKKEIEWLISHVCVTN